MARRGQGEENSGKVEYIRHDKEGRVNIPTQELKDFVADDEVRETRMLYARDPSLDPQLVWKGKDEQDQEDLGVPTVPIYIQEKIHPSAIIADLKARSGSTDSDPQLDLFGDFNGIVDFEKKVEFYQHEGHWTNRMILGDSLLVMNSLAEKEGLKGKVQCIYIDPPYGIKFGSNWQVSTRKRQVGDKVEDATRQPEQVRAFRDTWKLGIHSYLSYLRDRLTVARELLTESGSVFVQIGDENVHLVRNVLDEVFGAENFCSQIVFRKTMGAGSPMGGTQVVASVTDFIVWYAKDIGRVKYRELYEYRDEGERANYNFILTPEGDFQKLDKNKDRGKGRLYRRDNLTSTSSTGDAAKPYVFQGASYSPLPGGWKTSNPEGLDRLRAADRLEAYGTTLSYRRFADDFPYVRKSNMWTDTATGGYAEEKVYVVQTTRKVIERCVLMTSDPGDLVLDPTCGSGTTANVAEQWGRRWITIDTSRVALALARTRIMSGRYPYFLLSDSMEGLGKESEITGKVPPSYPTDNDVRKGFVCKRVPHVTLKSIANNPEIDGIAHRLDPLIERAVEAIREVTPLKWRVGQVPRDETEIRKYELSHTEYLEGHPETSHLKEVADLIYELEQTKAEDRAYVAFAYYWKLMDAKRNELDRAVLRHADTELLNDQPYEDSGRVRVSGPFTVESLAPHRVLSSADENQDGQVSHEESQHATDFATMILDNLRKAGVQNTRKDERLKFDSLEPHAGLYLHAKGMYTDGDGQTKTVAVSIGPEFGTVGPDWIKEAAKEAVKGVGFDLMIVCGFSFDGYASEEARQFGALTVLPVRMNNDLSMGDDLLKKTGAGNLFMVFGEPDLKFQTESDGRITVEVSGLDVYDPTTGQIRSGSTDDLAVWLLDTDYNGESFFVRHAYFLGGDDPYAKLKRALRAEIDEAAWSALYSTKSQPFPKPKSGKVAVKVINHYGDEVLKVYEVK